MGKHRKKSRRAHHERKTAAGTAGLYHIIAVIAMGKYRKNPVGSIMGGKRLPALLKPAWKIPQPENAKRLRDMGEDIIAYCRLPTDNMQSAACCRCKP